MKHISRYVQKIAIRAIALRLVMAETAEEQAMLIEALAELDPCKEWSADGQIMPLDAVKRSPKLTVINNDS